MVKIWKDRDGKWIDAKEFKERFSKGVEGVTPLQQVKTQLYFMWLTIVGILCGLGVSLYKWDSLWWLAIILLAGAGNTVVGMIGVYQKYKALKRIKLAIMEEHNEL